jgi:hypothetical protein
VTPLLFIGEIRRLLHSGHEMRIAPLPGFAAGNDALDPVPM